MEYALSVLSVLVTARCATYPRDNPIINTASMIIDADRFVIGLKHE